MSEEQVIQEPGVPYTVAGRGASEERLGVEIPPYFDRFLEERDRRIASEFSRLEAAIAHNGREIARVLREIDRRFAETDEKLEVLRAEMDRRFAEAKEEREALRAEMDRRFAEAKEEREELRAEIRTLRTEMQGQFRWIMGLLFPLVIGMLVIIARVFLMGTF